MRTQVSVHGADRTGALPPPSLLVEVLRLLIYSFTVTYDAENPTSFPTHLGVIKHIPTVTKSSWVEDWNVIFLAANALSRA